MIVCEAAGADWLPWTPLRRTVRVVRRGQRSSGAQPTERTYVEVVWVQDDQPPVQGTLL